MSKVALIAKLPVQPGKRDEFVEIGRIDVHRRCSGEGRAAMRDERQDERQEKLMHASLPRG